MATYQELLVQKNELEQRIAEKREEEILLVIAGIREQIAAYGFTFRDLFERHEARDVTRVWHAPRYRDPKSGETWSGRGRPPAWFDKRTRDIFAVSEQRQPVSRDV
ncbi:hypothetical protein EOS_17745 [Caballeronia mineralivorans PML1(12)]|uniref:DNA-binding protein H-NS-like C-terminal domain-containing protein n=1 Tax=Caballeronia mineralivorans PML1(12) TaxID=908627 RepID=A0A0J1FY56_9BURK|nr:H-NS histone family protein [Caballeronia mineralivorans]KLU24883.1 hypothetical protein EOS_17745 [Caballeronia mineralivorans PML1(12)]